MAINPSTTNIINIPELNEATAVQLDDLVIIGQGIYARRSTIRKLYEMFGIETINSVLIQVQDDIVDIQTQLGDNLKFTVQTLSATQQQVSRDNIDVYSRTEVDDAISTATAAKTKGLFEHILTAGDIANPIMTFQLPHTPIMDEWEFLYVGAGIVSPVSYSVTGDILTINTATFTYPVQAGRRLLYRYKY